MDGRSRILVALAPLLLATAACGDDADETADGQPSTREPVTEPDAEDSAGGTTSTTATTVADATAEPPPGETGGDEEGLGDAFVYVAELAGGNVVPGPGDTSATGRVEIRSAGPGELCIDMVATALSGAVTEAHVHEGESGTSGGVVVDIGEPTTSEADTDRWTDVCVAVDEQLLGRLDTDASRFHADVHTADLADGAVRGQLEYATIFDLELS